MAEYMRNYRATPEGKKRTTFADWKFHGLIGDYDTIYQRYITTTNCDICGHLLTKEKLGGRQKHMDHNHETGEFRNVVCQKCNHQKLDRQIGRNNTSGHKGVRLHTRKRGTDMWIYRKQHNNITFKISRKNKTELLCLKFAYLILINHRRNKI